MKKTIIAIILLGLIICGCESQLTSVEKFNVWVDEMINEELSEEMLGNNVPASAVNWALAVPHTSTVTTINVIDFEDLRDNDIATSSMPTKIYLVIEAENADNTEIVVCPVASANEENTEFKNCTRGLAFYGTSETAVTANKKSHPAGSSVIMSNVGQFFTNFVDIIDDQTIAGIKTFSEFPLSSIGGGIATSSLQFATKAYVDNVGAGGFTSANVGDDYGLTVEGTSPEKVKIQVATSTALMTLGFDNGGLYAKASTTHFYVDDGSELMVATTSHFKFAELSIASSTMTATTTMATTTITYLELNGTSTENLVNGNNADLLHTHNDDIIWVNLMPGQDNTIQFYDQGSTANGYPLNGIGLSDTVNETAGGMFYIPSEKRISQLDFLWTAGGGTGNIMYAASSTIMTDSKAMGVNTLNGSDNSILSAECTGSDICFETVSTSSIDTIATSTGMAWFKLMRRGAEAGDDGIVAGVIGLRVEFRNN